MIGLYTAMMALAEQRARYAHASTRARIAFRVAMLGIILVALVF